MLELAQLPGATTVEAAAAAAAAAVTVLDQRRRRPARQPGTELRLGDGVVFHIYAPYRQVVKAVERCLRTRELIEIVSPAGKVRYVNALQTVTIREL